MRRTLFILLGLCCLGGGHWASARVVESLDAFIDSLAAGEGVVVQAVTRYLTEEQLRQIEKQAGTRPPMGKVVHARQLTRDGHVLATVYLDRHRVRTLSETLGIAVSPEGKVLRTGVLTFAEPLQYKARDSWLELFSGKQVDQLPAYRKDIDGISGATLTGRAVTDAVRRTLVLHDLLVESNK